MAFLTLFVLYLHSKNKRTRFRGGGMAMEGTRASFDKLKANKAISSVRAEAHPTTIYPATIQSERFFDNIHRHRVHW